MPLTTRKRAREGDLGNLGIEAGPSSAAAHDQPVTSTSAAAGHWQGPVLRSKGDKVGLPCPLPTLIGCRRPC